MVVMGNPPYSGESQNKGGWIMEQMESYKVEPGGKTKLQERNPKWLNDDYVKFIRLAEYYVEKNGTGGKIRRARSGDAGHHRMAGAESC